MYDRSNVDYDVLCAEILKHRKFLRIILVLLSSKVDEWINDLNELILSVCHDEGTDASDLEIKIVYQVALLVEVCSGGEKLSLHSSADPGEEVLVTNTLE